MFAGWTAADAVAPAADVARFAYDLFGGAGPRLLSAASVAHMEARRGLDPYGFATFELSGQWGVRGPDGAAFGHAGATYGFDSMVAYFPSLGCAFLVVH